MKFISTLGAGYLVHSGQPDGYVTLFFSKAYTENSMSSKAFFIGALVTAAMISGIISFCRDVLWPETKLPTSCSMGEAHRTLTTAHDPTLRKLAEYETLCKGGATNQLMTFAAIPATNDEAVAGATAMANTLKEFSDFSITPLVIFEPSLSSSSIMADIKTGMYDEALKTYFETLKQAGISSQQMGTWVLFPEANTPAWHNTNPQDFTANIAKVAKLQKSVFPDSKTSVLLDSWSYQSDDLSWSRGELKSLLPFVKDLPLGLIDTFGLQGFPYRPPLGTDGEDRITAADFLPAHLANEAASSLKVKSVWLNTGTFHSMYATTTEEVQLSPDERKAALSSILHEAQLLQKDAFAVSINIFAQNKAELAEHVDWSYWPIATPAEGPDAAVLEHFLRQLRQYSIPVSFYDF